jgi:hypothetical protein
VAFKKPNLSPVSISDKLCVSQEKQETLPLTQSPTAIATHSHITFFIKGGIPPLLYSISEDIL